MTSVNKKDKKRSMQLSDKSLSIYTVGKKMEGPAQITPVDLCTTLEAAAIRAVKKNNDTAV